MISARVYTATLTEDYFSFLLADNESEISLTGRY